MSKIRKTVFTEAELADLYTGHTDMAHSIAIKFTKKYKCPWDTIHDEALSLLGIIIARWHVGGQGQGAYNGQCSPTTWIYRILYWQLQTWLRTQGRVVSSFSTYDTEEEAFEPVQKPSWLFKVLRNCGEEAQFLVRTIVYTPWELADFVRGGNKAKARAAVREWLEERCEWTPQQIDKTWAEVDACLV